MALLGAVGVGLVLALLLPLLFLLTRAAWITVSCYYLTPARIRTILGGQGVRGPPPRLLVGNLRDVSALVAEATAGDMRSLSHDIVGRLLPHYVLWSKMYGRLFVYWYGSEPRVCVTDAGMVRELLSSRHAHVTGKSWLQRQGAKHFIGRGLIMANGATWSHQRHVVAPAFMADRLRGRVGHMAECARQTARALREAVARGGNEVEVGAHMARLAGDIIARTEFDTSYDTGKRIFRLIDELQRLTARSSRYLWVPASQYFPSKYRREIKRLNGELEQLLKESIQRSREIADEGRTPSSACGMGLLGMLLAETEKNKRRRTKSAGNDDDRELMGYDAQTMIDECKTFFFAGHETSALLLTWAIMLLATNPSWQDKARAEVASVCGDAPPTADHLPKLTVVSYPFTSGDPPFRPRSPPGGKQHGFAARTAADGDQRDAPAVPAGDAAAADGVRGHHARLRLRLRRAARAQGRVAVDPRAGHPPRRGRMGSGRARVQAGPVRARPAPAVGGAVPAVRVGAPQLRRPGLRHGRGQGRAGRAARQLPLRHLRRVPPRARERAHAPAAPRRARAPAAAVLTRN